MQCGCISFICMSACKKAFMLLRFDTIIPLYLQIILIYLCAIHFTHYYISEQAVYLLYNYKVTCHCLPCNIYLSTLCTLHFFELFVSFTETVSPAYSHSLYIFLKIVVLCVNTLRATKLSQIPCMHKYT